VPEVRLQQLTDATRANHGLNPLVRAGRLRELAEHQARVMAEQGFLYHSGEVPSGCVSWGENVGVGPSVRAVQHAFVDSPDHRANVLGDFDLVGYGVAKGDDMTWVAVVLCENALSPVLP
jgi:uncharacterized protein YkwD